MDGDTVPGGRRRAWSFGWTSPAASCVCAPLAVYRIPPGELAEIGFPVDSGSVVVTRRDGRVWYVPAGQDFDAFAQAVGRAAAHAEVRVNDMPRQLTDRLR